MTSFLTDETELNLRARFERDCSLIYAWYFESFGIAMPVAFKSYSYLV